MSNTLKSIRFILLIAAIACSSCTNEKKLRTFDPSYEEFLSLFTTRQVVIFNREEKSDTFIFHPLKEHLEKVRQIERGNYEVCSKTVEYELTTGSYHSGMLNGRQTFFRVSNYSYSDKTSAYLHFLELGYYEDKIDSCFGADSVIFDRSMARDSFTIINKDYCINNVVFKKGKGILEFMDCRGQVWKRK